MTPFLRVYLVFGLLSGLAPSQAAGQAPKEVTEKIDAVVASAYQAASVKLPCKISQLRKLHMLRWQDIDKCLSSTANTVNWGELSAQLNGIRPVGVPENEFAVAVEDSLTRHALTFDKMFLVKGANALLPLTNSILKYLPPNSLTGFPVYDQTGKQIGTFAGIYGSERPGALVVGQTFTTTLFQYLDLQGKVQAPAERILLDSYAVTWAKALAQPGFRLMIERIPGIGKK